MTPETQPILIAYDGSDNADHAIAVAAEMFAGARVELIHAWEPAFRAAARGAIYLVAPAESEGTIEQERARAREVAERGAAVAALGGLRGHGRRSHRGQRAALADDREPRRTGFAAADRDGHPRADRRAPRRSAASPTTSPRTQRRRCLTVPSAG